MNRLLAKFNKLNDMNAQVHQLQLKINVLTNEIMEVIESNVSNVVLNNADGCHNLCLRLLSPKNKQAVLDMFYKKLNDEMNC